MPPTKFATTMTIAATGTHTGTSLESRTPIVSRIGPSENQTRNP
jgi:hypothetical protein